MAYIELKDVIKRYGPKLSVDHLNLSIDKGEIVGLLGPNGAGKSTTINMILGLLPLDGGDIRVDGRSVQSHAREIKRYIGLVPQDIAVYEQVSAADNIRFFGRLYGLKGQLLSDRVLEALEFVGLEKHARELPSTFSGGMKRRLNIACAIMHRPQIIIMDEPTVGIDPQSRNHILESVRSLNRMGSTIIYTSHYMEEVAAISDRVAIMDKGHIIAYGTEQELKERVFREEKIILEVSGWKQAAWEELQQHPRITRVAEENGRVEIALPSAQGCLQDVLFICGRHEVVILSLVCEEPNLESLFLQLTGRLLRD
ncbi:ABC transporter ATP-binding protein [Paenibacillus sp. FSL K6-1230]|uniref:ABC transporter ATP-binding protein n=1 Tax=Paenibacillus sp. FSL K6-1230 TaxID=2921603 RepID=UPI0030F59D3E